MSIKEIKFVILNLSQKNLQAQMISLANSTKFLKK